MMVTERDGKASNMHFVHHKGKPDCLQKALKLDCRFPTLHEQQALVTGPRALQPVVLYFTIELNPLISLV